MSSCSSIHLTKKQAIIKAYACLDAIYRERDRQKLELISLEKERLAKSWFRRLFRIPAPSDEKIWEKACRPAMLFSDADYINMYANRQENIAWRVIRASRYLSDDEVISLSLEDLDALDF